MPKYFIKIRYSKKTANLLEEAVLKALFELNQTLWPTLEQVKFVVYQKFDDAVMAYRGRCKMSRPHGRENTPGEYDIYADVCNVAIQLVKTDYTLGAQGYVFVGDANIDQLRAIDIILKMPAPPELPELVTQKH